MTKNRLTDKYTMCFDLWGLLLFAAIMLPNILWMFFPAPNDLLRAESVTPVIDGIASFCQMLMVFCLCLIIRRDVQPLRLSPHSYVRMCLRAGVLACMGLLLRRPCGAARRSADDPAPLRRVSSVPVDAGQPDRPDPGHRVHGLSHPLCLLQFLEAGLIFLPIIFAVHSHCGHNSVVI